MRSGNDADRMGPLEEILRLSRLQKKLVEENRLKELNETMARRLENMARLKSAMSGDGLTPCEKAVVDRIIANDRMMIMNIEASLDVTGRHLRSIALGSGARSAYGVGRQRGGGRRV